MSDCPRVSSWNVTSFDVSRPCLHDDGGVGRYWIKGANGMRVRYARAVVSRLRQLSGDILDLKMDETTYI